MVNGESDARVSQGFGAVFVLCQHSLKFAGQCRAAEHDHAFDLFFVGHGHYSRLNGGVDARFARFFREIVKIFVVKEKLGNEPVCSGGDFLPQVFYVRVKVFGLDVPLGVASGENFKFVACFLANEGNKLGGVAKVMLWLHVRRFVPP